jgi:hypothetical protein
VGWDSFRTPHTLLHPKNYYYSTAVQEIPPCPRYRSTPTRHESVLRPLRYAQLAPKSTPTRHCIRKAFALRRSILRYVQVCHGTFYSYLLVSISQRPFDALLPCFTRGPKGHSIRNTFGLLAKDTHKFVFDSPNTRIFPTHFRLSPSPPCLSQTPRTLSTA